MPDPDERKRRIVGICMSKAKGGVDFSRKAEDFFQIKWSFGDSCRVHAFFFA